MTYFKKLVAGISALSFLANANMAQAQMVPTAKSPSVASAAGPALAHSVDELVLVEGDPEAIRTRVLPPMAPKAMNQNGNVAWMTRQEWRAKGWSDAGFDAMREQNVGLCQKTAYFTERFASLTDRYRSKIPRVEQIAVRYDKMRRKLKRAGFLSTVANIAAPVIALVIPGGSVGYAGLVGAGSLGNEGKNRASTKQQLLANDAGQLNNELTGDHIEFNLMSLELYTDYLGLMNDYCTSSRVVASYGGKMYGSGVESKAVSTTSRAVTTTTTRPSGPQDIVPPSFRRRP